MKKTIIALLAAALVFSACACGSGGASEKTAAETAAAAEIKTPETTAATIAEVKASETAAAATATETAAPTAAETYEGEYTLFASQNGDLCASNTALGMESVITLYKDGSGKITQNGEEAALDSWSVEDGVMTLTVGGEPAKGEISGGILKLGYGGDIYGYYAAEGADTSAIKALSEEELNAVLESMNAAAEDDGENGKSSSALADRLGIYSDDTHFVMEMIGVLMDYEHDGSKVTGCTGYVDVLSEEEAKKAVMRYKEEDDSVESVTNDGSIVIIKYKKSAFKTLTPASLESVFGDDKIVRP